MPDLLSGLNPQQIQAVTASPGPTLIVAGPGSGKTRVLTHRIAWLVQQGTPPFRIMAVTFTNKAAREMRDRVEKLLGGALGGLTIGTFHSICARFLRREAGAHDRSILSGGPQGGPQSKDAPRLDVTRDFVIFDDSDQLAVVKQAMEYLKLDDKQYRPQGLLGAISKAKNELIPPEDYPIQTYNDEIRARVYVEYQKRLRENNAFDFDDLLTETVYLFRRHPDVLKKYQDFYDHVLVDEFQDTNTAQYVLLKLLAATKRNLYCVGDPDQSIYKWRGADYRNVRRFQDDNPDAVTILLEQNYRSTQLILDAAMSVIDRNKGRTRKELFTDREGGAQIQFYEAYNEEEEALYAIQTIATLTARDKVSPSDVAIMYRTNAQSRAFEDAFVRANLPYRIVGAQRFYGRREVKDLIAFLRLVHNPADGVSLLRVVNVPPRGLGAKTLETLQAAAERAGIPMSAILRDLGLNRLNSRYAAEFKGKAGAALSEFGEILNGWIAIKESTPVAKLMDRILSDIDYRRYINDGSEEGEARWENVMELRGVALETESISLSAFLEEIALVADADTLNEGAGPTLLTLHAAKGLEFPVVFITGLNEKVLPHQRSLDDAEEMAEERRLMYVGLTRAKDRLFLTRPHRITSYGNYDVADASRFLNDIPNHLLLGKPSRRAGADSAFARMTTWDTDTASSRGGAGPRPVHTRPAQRESIPTESRYRTGQRVKHPSFGEGMIIESKGTGDDEIIVIAFEGTGIKRLAANMVELKILKN
jgi:DNA helicase-2/ATP-dependent DNA helicase PcrA